MTEFSFPLRKDVPAKTVKRRCHRCHGSARSPCQFCSGKGQVVVGRDLAGNPITATCSACFGLKTARCSNCSGTGFL